MRDPTSSTWMACQALEGLLSCFFRTATHRRSDHRCTDTASWERTAISGMTPDSKLSGWHCCEDQPAHQLLKAHWAAVRLLEAQLVLDAALVVLRRERLNTCSSAKASLRAEGAWASPRPCANCRPALLAAQCSYLCFAQGGGPPKKNFWTEAVPT